MQSTTEIRPSISHRTDTAATTPEAKPVRLHYLDWLHVLAILGVFLFHAVHPFDVFPWEIKNADKSVVATLFIVYFGAWGMPFFFTMTGATSWFALRRRTGRRYAVERVKRLLVPFVVGSLLLSPLQLYFEWRHKTQTGLFAGSFLEFFQQRPISFGPQVFGWAGYHLWFVGFLFAYALMTLPLLLWLKRDAGQRFVSWLAKLCERRGGILVLILPLALVRFVLQPFFPAEHDWADFCYTLFFYLYGYILYADPRFARAIRRNWLLALILGVLSTLFLIGAGVADVVSTWMSTPSLLGFYLAWGAFGVNGWCWTLFVLYVGMRYLDVSNKWLQYGQEASYPFYLLHQPVIVVIAFYVVQWEAPLPVKLLVVVLGSFGATLALYELLVRRLGPVRALLGMKSKRRGAQPTKAAGLSETGR
jgi:glucan biosynthesis protein C